MAKINIIGEVLDKTETAIAKRLLAAEVIIKASELPLPVYDDTEEIHTFLERRRVFLNDRMGEGQYSPKAQSRAHQQKFDLEAQLREIAAFRRHWYDWKRRN